MCTFGGPGLQTTTKIQRDDSQRETKRAKLGAGEKKKERNFGQSGGGRSGGGLSGGGWPHSTRTQHTHTHKTQQKQQQSSKSSSNSSSRAAKAAAIAAAIAAASNRSSSKSSLATYRPLELAQKNPRRGSWRERSC